MAQGGIAVTEAEEQKAIVLWFRTKYPKYAMSLRASQSGGFKGKGRRGAIRMSEIKAMGGVTGESDLQIALPRGVYGSLFIEHKAEGAAHKATESQLAYIDYHNKHGNCAVVTRGIDMAIKAIDQYMGLPE